MKIDTRSFRRLSFCEKALVLKAHERDAKDLIHNGDDQGRYAGRLLLRNVEKVRKRYGIKD